MEAVLLLIVTGGFTLMGFGYKSLHNTITTQITQLDKKLSEKIESGDNRLAERIEAGDNHLATQFTTAFRALEIRMDGFEKQLGKLNETVTDIDRRLCRLEGAFSSKDCCMIKDSSQMRKTSEG